MPECLVCHTDFLVKPNHPRQKYCSRKCVYADPEWRTGSRVDHMRGPRTESFRKKMREVSSGSKNGMFGKTHSKESLEKMSQSHRGKEVWNSGKSWIRTGKGAVIISEDERAALSGRGYSIRRRVSSLLFSKRNRFDKKLGYDRDSLRNHIQSLFEEGMNWENYGQKKSNWSLDHIFPISKFPETSLISEINSLKNLRPCWVTENSKKNARVSIFQSSRK